MAINKERLAIGLAALRSGEFKQGVDSLRQTVGSLEDPTFTYCCLGVLTEVALREGCPGIKRKPEIGGKIWYQVFIPPVACTCSNEECEDRQGRWIDGSSGVLANAVADYFGFNQNDPLVPHPLMPDQSSRTSGLNDGLRLDFETIAQIFEDTFMKEEEQ